MMAATRGGRRRRNVPDATQGMPGATGDPVIAAEPAQQLPLLSQQPDPSSPHVEQQRPIDSVAVSGPNFDLYALAIASVRGVGVHVLRGLIDQYGDLRLFWDDDTPTMRDALARAKAKESAAIATHIAANRSRLLEEADAMRQRMRHDGILLLGADDPRFPNGLRQLPDAPYWLFVQGNPAVLNGPPLVGIVGTREASRDGVITTRRFTWQVTGQGFGIVSGLAEGIDATAHAQAFYFQAPQVAVLGTGINVTFPASTRSIRQRIISDGGAVITEYFPDDMYDRTRFVQRNRIQAGLSTVVAPVESRVKSGTAHTVRFAERYQRPLMGVYMHTPAPTNEMVRLLQERGHPTFDIADAAGVEAMLSFLRGIVGDDWPEPPRPMDPQRLYRHVLKALDDLEAVVSLSEHDRRWFVDYIAERYNLPRWRAQPPRDR